MIQAFSAPPLRRGRRPSMSAANNNSAMATCIRDSVEDEEHIFRSQLPEVQVPDDITLPEFVLQNAESYADNVAFVEAVSGKAYTYREVVRDTSRFAKALSSLRLKKGQVVIVVLPNVAEYAIVALGIMAAGGVFSGVNPAAHISEIKKQVEVADAKLVVTNSSSFEKVKELKLPVIVVGEELIEGSMNWHQLLEAADRAGNNFVKEDIKQTDLCALPFSSGTTGVSKGVMLTHRNLVANLCSTLSGVPQEMVGKVTTLGLIPFFHIYGITGICCATLRNKGKVVVMGRFDLRTFINALITQEVTFAPIVPPIILALVKNPIVKEFDLSGLKLQAIMTAAAPLAPELQTSFEKKFPGVDVQEAYGLTEHSCITLNYGSIGKDNLTLQRKTRGRSLPKNTPGEICVRSQCVMQGYYNNEEETSRTIDDKGWMHTGDIGYIDDDGDVFIVDRIKELIKYKGFQVAPAELEAILLTHPSIEDAAVVPLPDKEAGEIPAASIVMTPNAKETEDEIIKYVASNVAHYKKVRLVHFVETIPKSPSGKVMRRLIKEKMIEKIRAETAS
ncbi:4-coumarate--CoA ligase-like 1, partial [Cucurbita argyrosperma subsp. sororia]